MTDTTTEHSEPAKPLGLPLINKLGPLPEGVDELQVLWRGEREFVRPHGDYYTADQMRAYAAQEVAAERERWIVACNTVSDDAERRRRPGVQTVAQVRKLAIDGPNAELTGRQLPK